MLCQLTLTDERRSTYRPVATNEGSGGRHVLCMSNRIVATYTLMGMAAYRTLQSRRIHLCCQIYSLHPIKSHIHSFCLWMIYLLLQFGMWVTNPYTKCFLLTGTHSANMDGGRRNGLEWIISSPIYHSSTRSSSLPLNTTMCVSLRHLKTSDPSDTRNCRLVYQLLTSWIRINYSHPIDFSETQREQ